MRPEEIRTALGGAADLEERSVMSGGQALTAFFIDGLTAGAEIAELVLRPLRECVCAGSAEEVMQQALHGAVWCASCSAAQTIEDAVEKLLNGFCVVVYPDGQTLCFETKTGEKRAVGAPKSENTVKGAKDAFTETLRTNTSLVRRHLRTPRLRLEQRTVGHVSGTCVCLCYLDGCADAQRVARMRTRLGQLRLEGLLSPASVEESVTGCRRTAFPMMQYTERTDKFCQGLMDGQVGLLVDGLPEGFLAPVTLGRLMQSPEDRAVDYVSASFVRVLRYLALAVALLLPAVYTAMAAFHPQMLPTRLLSAIIASKQDVPFPTILEVIGLLLAFEVLQEAGLHLPQAIGTATSIIGGLVVGTAAVDARLVSPAALIVAAAAGICGFALPDRDLSDALRLWRLVLTALGGIAGLFGVSVGTLALLVHLAGLSSLGEAYLEPFSAVRAGDALRRRRYRTREERGA